VEVAADGAAPALEQLRDALRRGPSGASVTAVDDVEDRSATDGSELARPFTILR
jgi:acylphosphatase